MVVSRAYVQRQSQVIAGLSKSAKKTLTKRLDNLDDWDATSKALIETCKAYTDMSASITAQYYAGIRSASKVKSKYQAQSISGFDAEKVHGAAIAILQEAQEGRATTSALELLSNVANREIKNASDYCIRENTKRDPAKPRYAIVPNGDACAFCLMRASLGYTYGDADAAESHNHCTCTATPVYGNEKIEGYDPKEYEAKYNEARDALARGDVSEDLQAKIDAQKEAKGKDFDKTNAILMVMREQQGIS